MALRVVSILSKMLLEDPGKKLFRIKRVTKRSIMLQNRSTQKPPPYFERVEELRRTARKVLKKTGGMPINELHKKLRRFKIPTTKHLAAVLSKDPRKRFKSENKIWYTLVTINK